MDGQRSEVRGSVTEIAEVGSFLPVQNVAKGFCRARTDEEGVVGLQSPQCVGKTSKNWGQR